ncbi:MAG TPA: phosphate ABC transporter permease subunit PstC [Candidatus Sulfopaludibacter sp.]|jgi:phosphate transport system permease protein|nr:phosphate ABC transporter permease subunit PstC [Candidatus Sulfopaludibacter sp.]
MSAPALVNKPGTARRFLNGDDVAHIVTFVFAASVLLVTAILVWELWTQSAESRTKFGFHFLTTSDWDPVQGQFGALPFIYGTVVTSVLALLISVPLGVGAAIFLAELAPPRVATICTFLVELLAAIPSVIYGLLALFTIVPLLSKYGEPFLKKTLGFLPFFQGPAIGVGYLAAGIVLSVMMFPFIIAISRESLAEVPRDQREAALALGATRWEATSKVVVPYARLGIFGSIFLGLARALGETMAVTMVIGNDPSIHASLFAPGATIAAVIANEFAEAGSSLQASALIEMGLVLFLVTIVVNALARLLVLATSRKGTAHAS